MPKKNGHEVLAEIEADPVLKQIPVVLLTVSERDEDILEALRLKMNYYLAKPVTADKLSLLVRSIYELQAEGVPSSTACSVEETHVRMILAGNPHTAAVALTKLADDPNTRVRCRVAENPNVSLATLSKLALDTDTDVRLSICENPNTPASMLEALAKDQSDDVRMGMATNGRTPIALLKDLANDDNIYVSSSAKKTLAAGTSV
jgi:CheY-like chemotaxis protein